MQRVFVGMPHYNIKCQPKVPTVMPVIYRHIPKIGKNGLLDLSCLSVCMQQLGSQWTDFLTVGLHVNAAFCCNLCWWYRHAHLLCKSKQFSCFSVSMYFLCLNLLLRMEHSAPNWCRYSIPNFFRSLYITVLLTCRRIMTIFMHWCHACVAVHTRLYMCMCVTQSTTYK